MGQAHWATSEGRTDWLEPHLAVVASYHELHTRGARAVLDLGCGIGRHSLLFAKHGFDVEAIDGSLPASRWYAGRRWRAPGR